MSNLTKLTLDGVKRLGKQDIEDFKSEIKDKIECGLLSALEVNMFFKFLDKLYEGDDKKNNGLKHVIKESTESEFDFNKTGKEVIKGNYVIEEVETGVKWDFSNDSVWVELNDKLKEATDKRKEREEFLKKIPDGKPITETDTDTGEIIKLHRPLKTSTTSYKFTLKQ